MAFHVLSADLVAEILRQQALSPHDLSRADQVGWAMHGDAMIIALKMRAARCGLSTVAPPGLPCTQIMLFRECRQLYRPWQGRAAAGWYHTVFVADSGRIMIAGRESEGEDSPCGLLGAGIWDEPLVTDVPVPVAALAGVRIHSVATGLSHTLALSNSGSVYAWGSASYGRLGLDLSALDAEFSQLHGGVVCLPVKLHFSHEVVHISASDLCGLAVTTCGAVYTWGDGDLGQLGHGDTITQFVPKRVAALEQYKVVTASMEYRCTALTQNEAFVWGLGENGEIPSLPTSAGAMHCSPVPLAGLPPSVQLCEVSGYACTLPYITPRALCMLPLSLSL